MYQITLAWAQLERQTLRERTQAGMQRVSAEWKPVGRPRRRPLEDDPRWPRVRQLVLDGTLMRAEAARRLRVRYETLSAALRKGVAITAASPNSGRLADRALPKGTFPEPTRAGQPAS